MSYVRYNYLGGEASTVTTVARPLPSVSLTYKTLEISMDMNVSWLQKYGSCRAFDGLGRVWSFNDLAHAFLLMGATYEESLGDFSHSEDAPWCRGGEISTRGFFVRVEQCGEGELHAEILDFPDRVDPWPEPDPA